MFSGGIAKRYATGCNFVNVMGVLTSHEQQEFEKVFASVPPEVLEGRKKLGALSDIDLKLTVLKKYQSK